MTTLEKEEKTFEEAVCIKQAIIDMRVDTKMKISDVRRRTVDKANRIHYLPVKNLKTEALNKIFNTKILPYARSVEMSVTEKIKNEMGSILYPSNTI